MVEKNNASDPLGAAAALADAEAAAAAAGKKPGAGVPPGPEPEPEKKKIPTELQLKILLSLMLKKASVKFPSLLAVMPDPEVDAFCIALAPILDKYGSDSLGAIEKWQQEITAAIVCVPLAWSMATAVRADLARAADPLQAARDVTPAAEAAPTADKKDPPTGPSRGHNKNGVPKS